MSEPVLRLALGLTAALAVGGSAVWPAVRSATGPARGWRWQLVPFAGAVGLALLTVSSFGWARLGGRLAASSILALAAGLVALLALLSRGRRDRRPPPAAGLARPPLRRTLPWLPALLALAVFTWKLAVVPLWSWDHYAIWGVKARTMVSDGALEMGRLTAAGASLRPDYPLGLPAAWRVLTLGGEPQELDFRLAHGLSAWALVALVAAAARRASGSTLAAAAAAAAVAASPLLWDTESAGLADLPLTLFAVAAVLPLAGLAAGREAGKAPAATLWTAGVCAGFLPWIKSEGLPLAILLVLATAIGLARTGHRLRRVAAYAGPAVLLAVAGLVAMPGLVDREAGFFRGDWLARGAARLGELPQLAGRLASALAEPGWLGVWPLFALALVAAAAVSLRSGGRRAGVALAVGGTVAVQLTVYAGTYMVSYIPWPQHVDTSFYRVAAALVPLALVAAAGAAGTVLTGDGAGGNAAPGRSR